MKDEKAIEALQANAVGIPYDVSLFIIYLYIYISTPFSQVRALSNYLLYESGSKDAKVKQRMSEQGTVSASGVTRAVCYY